MAKYENRSAEERERLLESLCEAIRLVAPGRCIVICPGEGTLRDALADAAASLMLAGDHLEFVAERFAQIMAIPPPPRPAG